MNKNIIFKNNIYKSKVLISNIQDSVKNHNYLRVRRYRNSLNACFALLQIEDIPEEAHKEVSMLFVQIGKSIHNASSYLEGYEELNDDEVYTKIDLFVDSYKGFKRTIEKGCDVFAEMYLQDYMDNANALLGYDLEMIDASTQFTTGLGNADFGLYHEYLDHISAIQIMKD